MAQVCVAAAVPQLRIPPNSSVSMDQNLMVMQSIGISYSNANGFTLMKKSTLWSCGNPVTAKAVEFGGLKKVGREAKAKA